MGFLLFVLVILCIAYSVKMGGNETFKTFKLDEPMVLVTYALLGVIIVVGVMGCCTAFTMSKICACLSITLLLSLIIVLFIVASALFIPGMYGTKFVTDGCTALSNKNLKSISPAAAQDVFARMGAIDDALSTGVNANMCSEMCQCLGGPTSS